jgi:hypothetical protein
MLEHRDQMAAHIDLDVRVESLAVHASRIGPGVA